MRMHTPLCVFPPEASRRRFLALLITAIALWLPEPDSAAGQTFEKWVYLPANFLLPAEVDRVEKIMTEARSLGYSHAMIADSKFCRLHEMGKRYFDNIDRIRATAARLELQLVPAVFPVGYSNDLLSQNVNLAEGLPVRGALFEIRNNKATLLPDPVVTLPPVTERHSWNFIDETLQPDGDSLKATNPQGQNCRMMKSLKVSPYRHYHVSVRIRTKEFRGQPQITVLEPGTGRRLTHTNLKVSRTQEWSTQHITFNSLGNETVSIYIGAWEPNGGTIWFSDAAIEECGLLNVLRRDGTPLQVVTNEAVPEVLEEGKDFERVLDPLLGVSPYPGEYSIWHEVPSIRMKGEWKDGTTLRVSWYHPHVIYDGQVCACVTEPEFEDLLKQHAEGVEKLFPGTDRMMSHDEWRLLGWDQSFAKRAKTPGQIAAENVRFCKDLLQTLDSHRRIFVWNDMFDPHHNAVDNYYLVNGDLSGSWEGLDPDVVIMNWNFGVRAESMKFFAARGHRQVLAGFYDADANQIGKWLETVRKERIDGVIGVMYTTWQNDYSQLREFCEVVEQFESR